MKIRFGLSHVVSYFVAAMIAFSLIVGLIVYAVDGSAGLNIFLFSVATVLIIALGIVAAIFAFTPILMVVLMISESMNRNKKKD